MSAIKYESGGECVEKIVTHTRTHTHKKKKDEAFIQL